MKLSVTIGLEVHFQLNTNTKLFCACRNRHGQVANTDICPVCCGLPGALPVLNHDALEKALKAAIALDLDLLPQVQFDRKNYYYPDLPKGYQITQVHCPVAENGIFKIPAEGGMKGIRISRLHLEEDAGKTVYKKGIDNRFIDFNRSGTPLVEIVTLPDLHSSLEAGTCVRWLRSSMLYLGVCNGDMAAGDIRVDVNVSVKNSRAPGLGQKVELKNLNSVRYMQNAIDFEIKRQASVLLAGQTVRRETRFWNERRNETGSARQKEYREDYRYFPDPDLTAITISESWKNRLRYSLPALFSQKIRKFICGYGLTVREAEILAEHPEMAAYFENVLKSGITPDIVAKWLVNDVLAKIKDACRINRFHMTADSFSQLITLVVDGKISRRSAKMVMDLMAQTKQSVSEIVKEQHLYRIDHADEIEKIVQIVVDENKNMLENFKGGADKKRRYLTGLVMRKTNGRANPETVAEILEKRF